MAVDEFVLEVNNEHGQTATRQTIAAVRLAAPPKLNTRMRTAKHSGTPRYSGNLAPGMKGLLSTMKILAKRCTEARERFTSRPKLAIVVSL